MRGGMPPHAPCGAHLLGAFVALVCVSTSRAVEVFSVTANFAETNTFALGEFASRLRVCEGADFSALPNALKADCVHTLISSSAVCALSNSSQFECVINGVAVHTDDISFQCDGACPLEDPEIAAALAAAAPAAGCAAVTGVAGFAGACYPSAYCQVAGEGAPAFAGSFGEFCPSSTGEYCCGASAARAVQPPVTDLNFTMHYEVDVPAVLKVTVDVPYVDGDSYVGKAKMCPSTYMIDFEDPVASAPAGWPSTGRAAWLPLTQYPTADMLGRPRSSCGNYNMSYRNDTEFANHFVFPGASAHAGRLTYSGGNERWAMSAPGGRRVNYTITTPWDGTCQDGASNASLVKRNVEPEPTRMNGESYTVESYEWTMSVCHVTTNCGDPAKAGQYAKTCARVPAAFSMTPQQVSHVVTTPVSESLESLESLESKTFLQSVDALRSDCGDGEERVAVTLSLVMLAKDFSISAKQVHAVLSPAGIFEGPQGSQNETEITTVAHFLSTNPQAEGVYKLKSTDLSVGSNTLYREKLVILTKCYATGMDALTGRRASPEVFADAVAAGDGRVSFDVELGVKRDADTVAHTLSMRILATKETFVLPSADALATLESEQVVATLYGSYEAAKIDTAGASPGLSLSATPEMGGGGQVCSKHQAAGGDARVSSLTPSRVGACMLSANGVAAVAADGSPLRGTSVKYRTPGMQHHATYVFGCITDWIDIAEATLTDGVYEFPGQLTRMKGMHDSVFWFVDNDKLNEMLFTGTGKPLSDRFGAGIFYYNATSGAQVVQKSAHMQLDKITSELAPDQLTSGCVNASGNLMSSCNLVCFDLVAGLLSDPGGTRPRSVLVHHESLATVATGDKTPANTFGNGARRMLLQAVQPAPAAVSRKSAAMCVTVAPKARMITGVAVDGIEAGLEAGATTSATAPTATATTATATTATERSGGVVERDFTGPQDMQKISYPIVFFGVPALVLAVAWFVSENAKSTRNKLTRLVRRSNLRNA